ncbi:hypothetical protein BH780_gp011 [Bacillus phage Eldridge]|uniref:Uncharacterized protein n=1 Tax=Bacillus phage Eldridge TaxID=1776293 RepID=A0A109QIS2_9CAUD|nr:hypothetical protein BH780_gp011 [Bacillus phage Eldridge]AMB18594.1 hypothetical protein Eldridge_011 [Bacillus phage Eldridge]
MEKRSYGRIEPAKDGHKENPFLYGYCRFQYLYNIRGEQLKW